MASKIRLSTVLMWWDERTELADMFTDIVLERAMTCGDDNTISDYSNFLRESGKFTVPNLADVESLLRHAGLTTKFDGRVTRVYI